MLFDFCYCQSMMEKKGERRGKRQWWGWKEQHGSYTDFTFALRTSNIISSIGPRARFYIWWNILFPFLFLALISPVEICDKKTRLVFEDEWKFSRSVVEQEFLRNDKKFVILTDYSWQPKPKCLYWTPRKRGTKLMYKFLLSLWDDPERKEKEVKLEWAIKHFFFFSPSRLYLPMCLWNVSLNFGNRSDAIHALLANQLDRIIHENTHARDQRLRWFKGTARMKCDGDFLQNYDKEKIPSILLLRLKIDD